MKENKENMLLEGIKVVGWSVFTVLNIVLLNYLMFKIKTASKETIFDTKNEFINVLIQNITYYQLWLMLSNAIIIGLGFVILITIFKGAIFGVKLLNREK